MKNTFIKIIWVGGRHAMRDYTNYLVYTRYNLKYKMLAYEIYGMNLCVTFNKVLA